MVTKSCRSRILANALAMRRLCLKKQMAHKPPVRVKAHGPGELNHPGRSRHPLSQQGHLRFAQRLKLLQQLLASPGEVWLTKSSEPEGGGGDANPVVGHRQGLRQTSVIQSPGRGQNAKHLVKLTCRPWQTLSESPGKSWRPGWPERSERHR